MTKENIINSDKYMRSISPFTDEFGVRSEDPIGKRVSVVLSLLSETLSPLQDGCLNHGLCRILWEGRSQLERDYEKIKDGCFIPGGIECVHRMRLTINDMCFLLRQGRCDEDEVLEARRETLLGVARELDKDLRQASQGVVPLRQIVPREVAIAS